VALVGTPVPVVVGGWRTGDVGNSVDAPRRLVGLTRQNCFVVAARFFLFLTPLSAITGEAARMNDVLISRARLLWVFASRPARSCGGRSAATEDATSRDEKVMGARYMVRGQRKKGGESWRVERGSVLIENGACDA